MAEPASHSGSEPLDPRDQIDVACDLFEADLKAGRRPDVNALLNRLSPEYHGRLLYELTLVALEYTGQRANFLSGPHSVNAPRSTPVGKPHHVNSSTNHNANSHTVRVLRSSAARASTVPLHNINGYELLSELGRGGMGVVYLARQISIDRLVALKVIHHSKFEAADEPKRQLLLERFDREAKAASRLEHANVATVYEVGEYDGSPYYSMRLVDGTSLSHIVQKGCLAPDVATDYLIPIVEAIHELHGMGVLHRDLKPSNILIEGATGTPVLTDFGLAKLIDSQADLTLTDEWVGSPPYMAPEQVMHATSVTEAADIYSLGATLYHLLTGRPPFQAETPAEVARQIIYCEPVAPRRLNPTIPRDLETICLKCLQKDEPARYATAHALADDLQAFRDRRPIRARPTSTVERVTRWCSRNRAWSTLIAACFVVIVGAALVATYFHRREQMAIATAADASLARRSARSQEFFNRSGFNHGSTVSALPWLVESLRLDQGTSRARIARQRIASVLNHGAELSWVVRHEQPLTCACLNYAGDRILSGGRDGTVKLWTAAGECLVSLTYGASVRHASFSHSGNLAAISTDDGKLHLMELPAAKQVGSAMSHPGYLREVKFSADGRYVVTVCSDHFVRVWATANGTLHKVLPLGSDESPVAQLALSDGSVGASRTGRDSVEVWNIDSGEILQPLRVGTGVTNLDISPSGETVATVSGQELCLWDIKKGAETFRTRLTTKLGEVKFTRDGLHVVASGDDSLLVLALDRLEAPAITIAHPHLQAFVVGPPGTLLAISDGSAAQLYALDGTEIQRALQQAADVVSAGLSRDGHLILTRLTDGTARVWRRDDGLSKGIAAGEQRIQSVRSTRDGRRVLVAAGDSWRIFSAEEMGFTEPGFAESKSSVAVDVSFDGDHVVVADATGAVTLWSRARDGAWQSTFSRPQQASIVAISGDGAEIAWGDAGGNISLMNINSKQLRQIGTLTSPVASLEFSPAGDVLLAADKQTIRVFPLDADSRQTPEPVAVEGGLRGARFSPNGTAVVAWTNDHHGVLWSIERGSATLLRCSSTINHVAFSMDSRWVLTAGEDGKAQLWQLSDGAAVGKSFRHPGALTFACFSPDGRSLALCDRDRNTRVWDIASAEPISVAISHSGNIVHAGFVDAVRLLTISDNAEIRLIDSSPSTVPLDRLSAISRTHSGQLVDERGQLRKLSFKQVVESAVTAGLAPR